MSVGGPRYGFLDETPLLEVCCQACGGYVGSYAPGRVPKTALCPRCAARRLRDYWAAGWARPSERAKEDHRCR